MIGRPKKHPSNRRNKQIAIRFTPYQSRMLKRLAKKGGITVSEMLRTVLLDLMEKHVPR